MPAGKVVKSPFIRVLILDENDKAIEGLMVQVPEKRRWQAVEYGHDIAETIADEYVTNRLTDDQVQVALERCGWPSFDERPR